MTASARTARRTVRDRARTNRAAQRIRRQGTASLTTHAIAASARDDDFCTGCYEDHDPAACGYNPANDYSAYNAA